MDPKKFLAMAEAVRESVMEAGDAGVPQGYLYAALMTVGCDLHTFNRILGILSDAGHITTDNTSFLVYPTRKGLDAAGKA